VLRILVAAIEIDLVDVNILDNGCFEYVMVDDEYVRFMLKIDFFFWSMMTLSTTLEASVFLQPCLLIQFNKHELQLHVEASQGLHNLK
jgi:hypothetical protein